MKRRLNNLKLDIANLVLVVLGELRLKVNKNTKNEHESGPAYQLVTRRGHGGVCDTSEKRVNGLPLPLVKQHEAHAWIHDKHEEICVSRLVKQVNSSRTHFNPFGPFRPLSLQAAHGGTRLHVRVRLQGAIRLKAREGWLVRSFLDEMGGVLSRGLWREAHFSARQPCSP